MEMLIYVHENVCLLKRKIVVIALVIVVIVAGIGAYFAYRYSQKKTNLPELSLTTLAPVNSLDEYQLTVLVNDFSAIGVPVGIKLVSAVISDGWLTPNGTPRMTDLGLGLDWPDPVSQELVPISDYTDGGISNLAWVNNSTLQSMYPQIEFQTNKTKQIDMVREAYNIIYNLTPYIWIPNPDTYFFVQPYVHNFVFNNYNEYFYNMMYYSPGSDGLSPSNNSTLTDVSAADQLAAPDYMDPATGFYTQDGPLYTALYQELIELNGTSVTHVVPVLAKNYTIQNYQNYTFTLRKDVTFNNSAPMNASDVWFSLYRTIVMGQGPGATNYGAFLFNDTQFADTLIALPWGFESALRAAHVALPYPGNTSNLNYSNVNFSANYLANMLSNFSPWNNATQREIMDYPDQAVVVNYSDPYTVQVKSLEPYRFFLEDLSQWWGAVTDPIFIDQHGGVSSMGSNSYTDQYGVPGTGPYEFQSIGSTFSTIVLKANPNYWAIGKSGIPAVAQPAHIRTIVLDFTISHADRVEGFIHNDYQISFVSQRYIGSIANVKPYSSLPMSSYFSNYGAQPSLYYVSMNTQRYPTSILDFRLALAYSVNYSAIDQSYYYGSKYLANNYLGPISPNFGPYYNPGGLSCITYNLKLAEHYINLAGIQGHFFVTLKNGTKLGDVSSDSGEIVFIQFTVHDLERNILMIGKNL